MKLFSLIPVILVSITLNTTARETGKTSIGFYKDFKDENLKRLASVDETKTMIENIISVIGLKPKFEIREANIPNAAAVIYGSKRYILYNPAFVSALNRAAGNKWASVSILAHEIGHHLNGHTLENGGSRPDLELESDEFSGFVLKKMGASLQEAQVAMKIAASQKASHSHPGQADRLYAIAKGWNTANNQMTGRSNDVASIYNKPEPVRPQAPLNTVITQQRQVNRPTQPVLAEQYILKDAYFHNDRNSNYYITIKGNLVKTTTAGVSVLGTLVSNENQNYPLLIVDGSNNYWLINKYGRIVTKEGKEIGYLSNHN